MENLFDQIDFDCWDEHEQKDDLTAEEIELIEELEKESQTEEIDES